MAAGAAFERLQPCSAYWFSLQPAPTQYTSISPTLGPRFAFPQLCRPGCGEFPAHLVLVHRLRRCAPVTHQDQGWPSLRCAAPGCDGSPRKPSVPYRVQCSRPGKPAAQVCGFAQWRSNPLWLTVRAQRTPCPGGIGTRRAIRSHGFTNPIATLPRPSH
jgi:hypothetical protein